MSEQDKKKTPGHEAMTTIYPMVSLTRIEVFDSEDFELPPACPLRNNGDDICEGCQ